MKRRMLVAGMVLLWMLVSIVPLDAEPTVKDYDQFKEMEVFKTYIGGMGAGFSLANAELIMRKQKPLYCAPLQLPPGEAIYLEILDRKMKDVKSMKPVPSDRSLGLVLLQALQETFPCDK